MSMDSIKNFHAFDDMFNPLAVVAYSKGATAYMAVLQELYFLGSADATDGALRSFVNTTANWLQARVDFHTSDQVNVQTVVDATNFEQDPPTWRFSCKPEDVAPDVPKIAGCTKIPGWTPDTDTCMIHSQLAATDKINLCLCDCGSPDKESACHYGPVGYPNSKTFPFLRATAKQAGMPAAAMLSERNWQLFNNSGIYTMIKTLRDMVALNPIMPQGSLGMYQNWYTPLLNCSTSLSTPNGREFLANHGLQPLGQRNVFQAAGAQQLASAPSGATQSIGGRS